jgi:DNA polymerase-3 subunit beta
MPILEAIRIDCTGSSAMLAATNLESAIQCVVVPQGEQGSTGAFLVNGDLLRKIVDALAGETVRIATEPQSGRVLIASDAAQFELPQLALEDYPNIPAKPTQTVCSIDRELLARSLELVSFAAMPERKATNLVLTGVFLQIQNNELTVAATDGYRLAVRTVPCITPTPDTHTLVISADFAAEIGKILYTIPETQTVEIFAAEQWLFVSAAHTVCIARLINEKYPDYAKVIPEQYSCVVDVERASLLAALERASITASEASGAAVFTIGDSIKIHSQDESKGQTQEHIPLLKPAQQPMTIAFRASYLAEALKKMRSPNVTFKVTAPDRPAVLSPNDTNDDRGFIYACMPLSIKE